MTTTRIAVVGAGAWGTALANVAARDGQDVILWGGSVDHVAALAAVRENRRHLPGVAIAAGVAFTAALADLKDADLVLVAVPSQAVRQVSLSLATVLRDGIPVLICAKGIERGSGLFMSEVVAATAPRAIPMVLSGPSFAADVARGLPTAVVLAGESGDRAAALASRLSSSTFRVYHGDDVRGVEIGGAAKNVLAIGCGIVAGRRLGESARAALVARGFAELTRFARAYGARPETLMGLAGLGDLVLTATSRQSRNFAFGEAVGRGLPVDKAIGAGKLVEGALTAQVLVEKASARGVDMPVAAAVDAVIAGRLPVNDAIEALMARPIGREV